MLWGVEFQHPYRLLLIIPVILIFFFKRRSFYWLGFNVMVIKPPQKFKRFILKLANALLLLAIISATIAYARPIYGEEEKITKLKVSQSCSALDMSGSMWDSVSNATKEKRIAVVMNAGKEFIDMRLGDMFALVPFSEKVKMGLTVPLTLDGDLIKRQMQAIADGSSGSSTSIGEGIWTCMVYLIRPNLPKTAKLDAGLLRSATEEKGLGPYAYEVARELGQLKHAFIVVLTDGENNEGIDPVRVLTLAARLGIRVYLVSATTERFPELVRAINQTGGRYFFARSMDESKRFYSEINQIEKREVIAEKKISHKNLKWYFYLASAVSLFTAGLARFIVVTVP